MLAQLRRLQTLLDARERRRLALVLAAISVMGVIDLIGVSSILPFMAVVAKPEAIQASAYLSGLYEYFEFSSPYRFLFFLGVVVLVTIVASNLWSAFVSWAVLKFSHDLGHTLSVRILRDLLGRPYLFFLDRNSTTLTLSVISEVGGLVMGVVLPGLQVLGRLVVTALILLLVLAVDPFLALVVTAVVGSAYLVIFTAVRRRLANLGESTVEANRLRFKAASEAFAGIKELRVLGRTSDFIDRFTLASREYARFQIHNGAIATLPRYAMESIAFGGILVILLYLLAVKKDINNALPLIALYAVAGYRLLPSVQQIFGGIAQVRFGLGSLGVLYRDYGTATAQRDPFAAPADESAAKMSFDRAIELRDITFVYPGTARPVLERLTLTIHKNTTMGIVGSTGSGKTTAIDILIGLLAPTGGALLVDGVEIQPKNVHAWQHHIGYVPQHIYLADDTIAHNIAFGISESAIDRNRVAHAATMAKLHDFITRDLPHGYDTVVGERGVRLSGGQRQRIGIARALYHDPDVLILDEATSALDGATEDAIIEAIRSLAHRKTIVLIAHRFATVQDCDAIALLEDGRVSDQGTYEELLARNERFRAMARVKVPAGVE